MYEFEITKHIAVLGTNEKNKWKKELNIVKWMNNPSKYDIRSWNTDHTKFSKGVTLSTEELHTLKGILEEHLR